MENPTISQDIEEISELSNDIHNLELFLNTSKSKFATHFIINIIKDLKELRTCIQKINEIKIKINTIRVKVPK